MLYNKHVRVVTASGWPFVGVYRILMKHSSSQVAFGRHESFHFRSCWLSKGYSGIHRDPILTFDADRGTVALGVGKNMVFSIRYWLRASRMISEAGSEATELGRFLLDPERGADSFLEDEGTLWLIHWLIASNSAFATTISWFFNKFQKPRFNQQELRAALGAFVQSSVESHRRPAATTQRTDVSVLTRTYAGPRGASPAEEMLDSPLAELGLMLDMGKNNYQSLFVARPGLPCEILGFALLELLASRGVSNLPLEDLLQSADDFVAPGTIFRLTEAGLMTKLEELTRAYPQVFDLRETAGLRQLFLRKSLPPIEMLKSYYEQTSQLSAGATA